MKLARILRRLLKRRLTYVFLTPFVVLLLIIARPAWVLTRAVLTDRDERRPIPSGNVDDSSRLDQTPMAQVWDVPPDDQLAEAGLRRVIARAHQDHLSISIAGARHSMGGQTIVPGGIQINMMTRNAMQFETGHQLLHVQTGARWAQIIQFIDTLGKSVAIMQSNNDFSVGGSLSVNCHGWQFDRPPISSTVESFRIMLADGSIRTCSRTQNRELFSLALGGYGLFGIILDAELHVVPNERYEVSQFTQPTSDFLSAWHSHLQPPAEIAMGLGRLSIASDDLFNHSLLYVMRRSPLPSGQIPPLTEPSGYAAARAVFLASADGDYGKTLRWRIETHLLPLLTPRILSRNQLLNMPAEVLANRTNATTDILQEYFVPPGHLGDFLAALKSIVLSSGANLRNVTIRDVREDHDSFLRYADQDMIALVLLYTQPRGPQSNSASSDPLMTKVTQETIDAALACGGRYYLPYRLDATPDQFHRAYPMADDFFRFKNQYDPDSVFQNEFYLRYATTTPSVPTSSHNP